jgi:hypothetical protein
MPPLERRHRMDNAWCPCLVVLSAYSPSPCSFVDHLNAHCTALA